MIFFMIETKSEFTPLPAAVLEKIINDGSYVLEGKYESYYISFCESDDESDPDFGSVLLCYQNGEVAMTAKPETFGYRGEDIFLFTNDNRACVFTLVKRVVTAVNVNELL
jgi:hypothetical protein